MEIIRNAADPKCSAHLEKSIKTIDSLLAIPQLKRQLKGLFGLADLEHDEDFASLIEVNRLKLAFMMKCVLNTVPLFSPHWGPGKLRIGTPRLEALDGKNFVKPSTSLYLVIRICCLIRPRFMIMILGW